MASATGIPDLNAARGAGEDEPLLGRRGDAAQVEGQTIWKNLWLGKLPLLRSLVHRGNGAG